MRVDPFDIAGLRVRLAKCFGSSNYPIVNVYGDNRIIMGLALDAQGKEHRREFLAMACTMVYTLAEARGVGEADLYNPGEGLAKVYMQ